MALDVPPSVYLEQLGDVMVTYGALSVTGILDTPTQMLEGGLALSTDYKLTIEAASLPGLDTGASLTLTSLVGLPANNGAYTVREVSPEGDGSFAIATLSKV